MMAPFDALENRSMCRCIIQWPHLEEIHLSAVGQWFIGQFYRLPILHFSVKFNRDPSRRQLWTRPTSLRGKLRCIKVNKMWPQSSPNLFKRADFSENNFLKKSTTRWTFHWLTQSTVLNEVDFGGPLIDIFKMNLNHYVHFRWQTSSWFWWVCTALDSKVLSTIGQLRSLCDRQSDP